MIPTKFAGIVFDMDGVLLDSERVFRDAFEELRAQKENRDIENFPYSKLVGLNTANSLEVLESFIGSKTRAADVFNEWEVIAHALFLNGGFRLKEGARETLDVVRELKIPCGLATSTGRNEVVRRFKLLDIGHYFHQAVCGDEVSCGKPSPMIYQEACRRLGVMPSECLMVEDSAAGLVAARTSGGVVVHVPDTEEQLLLDTSLFNFRLSSVIEVGRGMSRKCRDGSGADEWFFAP